MGGLFKVMVAIPSSFVRIITSYATGIPLSSRSLSIGKLLFKAKSGYFSTLFENQLRVPLSN